MKTEALGDKPVPGPICLSQIPQGLSWYRTRASALSDRSLTACAVTRLIFVGVAICSLHNITLF